MLTKGEAANNYDILYAIVDSSDFVFNLSDGQVIPRKKMDVKTFLSSLDSIESVESVKSKFPKMYLNPFMLLCLVNGLIPDKDTDPVSFRKLQYHVIGVMYDILHRSVAHGYRLGLDDVRRNVQTMLKSDENLVD